MFNSAQRAHQNTLENLPIVNLMTIAGALIAAPFRRSSARRSSAASSTSWRNTGGPSGRRLGSGISHLGDIPLFFLSLYSIFKLATM